jgi:hypothetical protein
MGRCCAVYSLGRKSVEAARSVWRSKSSIRRRRVPMVDPSAWKPSIMRSGRVGIQSVILLEQPVHREQPADEPVDRALWAPPALG